MFLSVKRLSLLMLCVFLSACQTLPKKVKVEGEGWSSDSTFFESEYRRYETLGQWQYRSKVGVVTPSESQQANMVWTSNQNDVDVVRLFGPLGLGAIKIEINEQGAVLSDRSGELHRGDNAQHLLEAIVGWSIPIDALKYWLFSLPLPNQQYVYQLDADQNLSTLKQFGWDIDYSHYHDYFNGEWVLARKIIAKKQVASEQEVKVTLITKSWK